MVVGDDRGTVAVAVAGADEEHPVSIELPTVEEVVAVDVVTLDAGARLVAAATPRAVYVYVVAADEADPAGGYDLLRGEGGVLDLAFVDGDPTRLAVLHSDLFVDVLDPQVSPDDVAADLRQLAGDRGLALGDDTCQDLVGRECPPG